MVVVWRADGGDNGCLLECVEGMEGRMRQQSRYFAKWYVCLRCRYLAVMLCFVGGSQLAFAGNQAEEHLADSVRTALNASIGNTTEAPEVICSSVDDRIEFTRWLIAASNHLRSRIPDFQTRTDFLRTVWYESKRAGLQPSLIMGLIQIESGFKKYALSNAGAMGYMQVMPFWIKLLRGGDVLRLFQMQTNLRFGCVILRHYLTIENGDMFMALGRYNGSRGKSKYPNAVLNAQNVWKNKLASSDQLMSVDSP